MAKAKDGDWYVYTGEDNDAIAVAMNGRGPNGGWRGIGLARMEMPSKDKTRKQINEAAKIMAAGKDLLAAAQQALACAQSLNPEMTAAYAALKTAVAKATT